MNRREPVKELDWVIVGLHGMNDYSNAFHLAAAWWAGQGIATYALDVRGFGRSPERGIWAPTNLVLDDVRALVGAVRQRHPNARIALAGVSMGGALAIAAMASDTPPAVDKLLLFAPAVWGWSNQPLPNRLSLWVTAHHGRDQGPNRLVLRRARPGDSARADRRGDLAPEAQRPYGLLRRGLPPAAGRQAGAERLERRGGLPARRARSLAALGRAARSGERQGHDSVGPAQAPKGRQENPDVAASAFGLVRR
jgi:alpha-beta hydrolase superfamily lysophospholipase